MIIRRLNDAGRAAFAQWVGDGGKGSPPDVLESSAHTEIFNAEVDISDDTFATRFDMGEYLLERLKSLGSDVIFDAGLWDWLSLFYIEQLWPAVSGVRKGQAKERFVIEFKNRKWSRHLVRMNWLCVREHGANALVMLTTSPHGHSEVLEQLAGQQELFGAKPVIAAATNLYLKDGGLKKGAQGKGPGSPRRLRRIMSQFRRTWDPQSMNADQVLALLPREFERWIKNKDTTAAAADATAVQPSA